MSAVRLTRAQRRLPQKLADRYRATQVNRLFFERRPDRQHRVRLASQVEIDQQKLFDGKPPPIPPGCRLFTVDRNIAPGVRMRLFVWNLEGAETDLSAAVARRIFEWVATTWEIEAQI